MTTEEKVFVRTKLPFVIVPTDDVNSTVDDQTTTQSDPTKEKQEITDDEDFTSKDDQNQRDDLRISQPQYSQLLKQLDFRFNRMVDVTDLLPDDINPTTESSVTNHDEENDDYPSIDIEIPKKSQVEEDDDTSKQATQNYDFHETDKQDPLPRSTTEHSYNNTDDDNLSSIPRLNPSDPIQWQNVMNSGDSSTPDGYRPPGAILIISQPVTESQRTPTKGEQNKPSISSRRLSTSSETDSIVEPVLQRSKVKSFPFVDQEQPSDLSLDEDLHDLNNHLTHYLLEHPTRKRPTRTTSDTWLAMLEKLEREHKQRLEQQQKQYETYMHELEEKMKRRFDEYVSSANNSFQESKSDTMTSTEPPPHHPRTYSNEYSSRRLSNYYPSNSNNDHQISSSSTTTNLSRSQSREDISSVRLELSAKHSKHISDLKLYYEHEIEELKNQLNRTRMGTTTSTTRQSIETIERMNNENIRLHDEVKDLRHSLKTIQDENNSMNRRVEEIRSQLSNREVELKNAHRNIAELEQQINEGCHIKERQEERFRHADRQVLLYREENEKLKKELNLTRERLARLEERHREQELESKNLRQPVFSSEHHTHRTGDETKLNSTMSLNMPTSREYGRYVMTTSRYLSSTITSPRDITNVPDDIYQPDHSPRTTARISDYINEKPSYSQSYRAPARTHYSPRKSPGRPPVDPIPDLIDNQLRHGEKLEEKFDELLRKKRDLEARMNRIPTRALTATDRHLLDTLEREIERVEQQISSVKLELRKMNILRTH